MRKTSVDYEVANLRKGGQIIGWPRVVGVAVEKGFKLADAGLGTSFLVAGDLDGYVYFSGIERRGEVNVALKAADATLATQIAQDISRHMTSLGYARVGLSDNPARDSRGRFVYDDDGRKLFHDLVYEEPSIAQVWSVEVKCVNAHVFSGLLAARERHRKGALSFWSTFTNAGADAR